MQIPHLRNALLLACIASHATAHFVLQLPASLGFNDTLETMSPCDSFDPTNRDTVTYWPTGGYPVLVLTTHEDVTWDYNFALVSDLIFKPFTPSLHQLGVGTFCEPQLPGLAEWIGQDVVFQAVQHAPDGLLYQCAAVTFIDGPAFPVDGLGCLNTTGITATWLDGSQTSSSTSLPTSSSSATLPPTSSSTPPTTSSSSAPPPPTSSPTTSSPSTTSSVPTNLPPKSSSSSSSPPKSTTSSPTTTPQQGGVVTATVTVTEHGATITSTVTSTITTGAVTVTKQGETVTSTVTTGTVTVTKQGETVTSTITTGTVTVTKQGETVTSTITTGTVTVTNGGACSTTATPASNTTLSASKASSVPSTTNTPVQILTAGADSHKIPSLALVAGILGAVAVF